MLSTQKYITQNTFSNMIRTFIIIISIISFVGCSSERNKNRHFSTTEICNKIYVERYIIFSSGAYGGDVHAKYLTDSINFRVYIGTEDTETENLFTLCKGDSLIVEKSFMSKGINSSKIISSKLYSKKVLVKEGKFD
jgi:hypothetical protein